MKPFTMFKGPTRKMGNEGFQDPRILYILQRLQAKGPRLPKFNSSQGKVSKRVKELMHLGLMVG